MEQTTRFCSNCHLDRLHARPGTNHLLHCIITLFLCGCWLPVWILSSIKIGGWRCQTCGSKGNLIARLILPLFMILSIGTFAIAGGLYLRHLSAAKVPSLTIPEIPLPSPPLTTPSESRSESPPFEKPANAPTFVSSLENVSLPVTVITTEAITLLNEAGIETPISAQTTIKILERAKRGSLNMKIGGMTFVGNESRLAGKAKFVSK